MTPTLQIIRETFERHTGFNIAVNYGKREVINAKAAYCVVARDYGHTVEKIGNFIQTHHSSVSYHCKTSWGLPQSDDRNELIRVIHVLLKINNGLQPPALTDRNDVDTGWGVGERNLNELK